jgi:tetratricopeptide (TPR) repeat protein
LGAAYTFAGDWERARERLDRATEIGEGLGSPLLLAATFNGRGIFAAYTGRQQERLAMLRQAREIALEHDLEALGSIYFNLSDAEFFRDQYEEALGYLEQGLARARRRGIRLGEWATLAETTFPLMMLGRWDEALERAREIPEDRLQETTTLSLLESSVQIRIARGEVAEARRVLGLYPETSADVQERLSVRGARAAVLRAEGRLEEAVAAALACLDDQSGTTPAAVFSPQQGKQAFPLAVETLLALGRRGEAAEWVARFDAVPPGLRPPFAQAQAQRLRALLDGDPSGFARAAAAFDELRIPFWAAVARLEEAELVDSVEERERLLASARAEFERLGAQPWLDRADAARAGAAVPA